MSRSPSSSAFTRIEIRSSLRALLAVRDHRTRVAPVFERDRGLARAALVVVRDRGDLAAAEQLVRPAQELRVVLARHAEHVADHGHRDPLRDLAHELALAARRNGVEQLGRELAQHRLVRRHAARREAAVHQVPAPLVLRIVEVDHRRDPRVALGARALSRAEQLRLARRLHDVVVARDAPEAAVRRLIPVDGRMLSQPAELRVRIDVEEAVVETHLRIRGMVGHLSLRTGSVRAYLDRHPRGWVVASRPFGGGRSSAG